MAKTYKTYLPEQDLLLPPSLRDWLPENHLVYCVSDVVDELDLSAIESVYEEEDRGQPPYHPRMMTKILVYGYCVGVFSSRRIQKRLTEDVAFRVLAAGNQPDFRTISDFRKLHLKALEELCHQQRAMIRSQSCVDELRDFFPAEDRRKVKCSFRIGRLGDAPGFLESLDVEESQSCQSLCNRARRQLVLLEQLGLIFTNVFRTQTIR